MSIAYKISVRYVIDKDEFGDGFMESRKSQKRGALTSGEPPNRCLSETRKWGNEYNACCKRWQHKEDVDLFQFLKLFFDDARSDYSSINMEGLTLSTSME